MFSSGMDLRALAGDVAEPDAIGLSILSGSHVTLVEEVLARLKQAGISFTVVDKTGALRQGVGRLVRRLQSREALVIPMGSNR